METYIKLYRKFTEWEWFTDGNMVKVWIYLLTHAQYKNSSYQGHKLKRGQVIVGRKMLAERLKLTENQVRTCLNKLKKTQEITIKSTNRYSIITIVKYDFYQGCDDENHQQEHNQITNKSPTNHHIKRNKEIKKEKNIYNSLPIYDTSKNKKMSQEEMEELMNLMKGEA